jgi:hypothetical protein
MSTFVKRERLPLFSSGGDYHYQGEFLSEFSATYVLYKSLSASVPLVLRYERTQELRYFSAD